MARETWRFYDGIHPGPDPDGPMIPARKTTGRQYGHGWFRADFLPFLLRLGVVLLGLVVCGLLIMLTTTG